MGLHRGYIGRLAWYGAGVGRVSDSWAYMTCDIIYYYIPIWCVRGAGVGRVPDHARALRLPHRPGAGARRGDAQPKCCTMGQCGCLIAPPLRSRPRCGGGPGGGEGGESPPPCSHRLPILLSVMYTGLKSGLNLQWCAPPHAPRADQEWPLGTRGSKGPDGPPARAGGDCKGAAGRGGLSIPGCLYTRRNAFAARLQCAPCALQAAVGKLKAAVGKHARLDPRDKPQPVNRDSRP